MSKLVRTTKPIVLPETKEKILEAVLEGFTTQSVANEYNVSLATVNRVIRAYKDAQNEK